MSHTCVVLSVDHTDNTTNTTSLDDLITTIRKIIKEARHNELIYPELNTITTYNELSTWINKYYKCFYSVFRQDLLAVLSAIPYTTTNAI